MYELVHLSCCSIAGGLTPETEIVDGTQDSKANLLSKLAELDHIVCQEDKHRLLAAVYIIKNH
jgi:hypothetical protein